MPPLFTRVFSQLELLAFAEVLRQYDLTTAALYTMLCAQPKEQRLLHIRSQLGAERFCWLMKTGRYQVTQLLSQFYTYCVLRFLCSYSASVAAAFCDVVVRSL
jgi:hypothetical protein